MSKAEEKTTELMKKAKDFIPDGGYSGKELNLAFFMFINGYHQAEKDLELTWNNVALILNVAEEFNRKNTIPISDEEYFKEVLKRFKDYKK